MKKLLLIVAVLLLILVSCHTQTNLQETESLQAVESQPELQPYEYYEQLFRLTLPNGEIVKGTFDELEINFSEIAKQRDEFFKNFEELDVQSLRIYFGDIINDASDYAIDEVRLLAALGEWQGATSDSWRQVYLRELGGRDWDILVFLDVDFDGIPEVFFYNRGAAGNSWHTVGFSYKNGEIVEMNIDHGDIIALGYDASLLRNRQTGVQGWLFSGENSSQAGRYHRWFYDFVDFSNFEQIKIERVFEYSHGPVLLD